MFKKILYTLFLIIIIISCKNNKSYLKYEQAETAAQLEESDETVTALMGIRPLDIKSPKFFWMLQPWKDGKLATIDGWGRFAEISFEKNNRIRIKHLAKFPRRQLDGIFITWPDADLLWVRTGLMQCIADVKNKKTKAFIPLLSWTYNSRHPVLLDKEKGLVLFSYDILREQKVFRQIYYNYLRDEIVSDTGKDQHMNFLWALDRERVLVDDFSQSYPHREGDKGFIDFYIYNRITGEKTRNKFTDTVKTLLPRSNNLTEHGAMSWSRRYLISDMEAEGYKGDFKISWNEDFSEVDILPLDAILQQQLQNDDYYYGEYFVLSPDGEWATSCVGGSEYLYNERLQIRVFYHMDSRYPRGMSMPILSEEYEGKNEPERAFVNHPEYGMCFAQEWHQEEGGKDQLYLRLYKMSDVLAEINRQLWEVKK